MPLTEGRVTIYPVELLITGRLMSLSELGRYMTNLMQAVEGNDRSADAVVNRPRFIGRIYWPTKARRGIPPAVRRAVFARDGRKCRFCGATDHPLELDHIKRYRDGGEDTVKNLRVLCKPCNRWRG